MSEKPRYSIHALTSGCIVLMDRETAQIIGEFRDERDAQAVLDRLNHHLGTISKLAHEVVELRSALIAGGDMRDVQNRVYKPTTDPVLRSHQINFDSHLAKHGYLARKPENAPANRQLAAEEAS